MPLRNLLIVLLALLASQPVAAARGDDFLSRLIPRKIVRPAGDGLLVVNVDASHAEPLTLEFAQADDSASGKVTVQAGSAGVMTLPSGRYCLKSVERDGRLHRTSECTHPYVDVNADSVDFTGPLKLLLRGKRARVLGREMPGRNLHLDDAQAARIVAWLEQGAARGVRTFLVSSPSEWPYVLRLRGDGIAEQQQYSVNNPSYQSHRWSGDPARLTIEDEAGRQDFTATQTGWHGVQTEGAGFPPGLSLRGNNQLVVTTDPRCWHWTACGSRIHRGVVATPDYTFAKNHERLAGRITLEFALQPHFEMSKPRDIRVVDSTLAKGDDAEVAEQFADMRFNAGPADTGRLRMEIEFRAADGRLVVEHGPAVPVVH